MFGDLLNAGSQFEDAPLTAADFQFSNALTAVDPSTGLPPVAAPSPLVVVAPIQSTSSLPTLAMIAAGLAWYFWPQIKQWGGRHAAV